MFLILISIVCVIVLIFLKCMDILLRKATLPFFVVASLLKGGQL